MPTIDQRVQTGADDANETATGNVSIGATTFTVDGTGEWGAARFQVTIPVAATITAAYLTLQFDDGTLDEPDLRIYGEDAASAAVYVGGTATFTISARARTTAFVDWGSTDLGAPGAFNTSSLVSIIQELVDSYDYSSGSNYIGIMWTSANNVGTRDAGVTFYNGNAATAPLLHIEYSEAGGGDVSISGALGTLTAAGLAATIVASGAASVAANLGAMTLTGLAAQVAISGDSSIAAALGLLTLDGQPATVIAPADEAIAASVGALQLTGLAATVMISGDATVQVSIGLLILAGVQASVFVGERITPPERIFVVVAENRVFAIAREVRTFAVAAEERIYSIA